jgi:hypothetical protein
VPLRPTYYDVKKKTDTKLLKFVRKDIYDLTASGDSVGPFSALDQYKNGFEEYLQSHIQTVIQGAQEIHRKQTGHTPPREVFWDQLRDSRELSQMVYRASADYLCITNFELFKRKTFYFADNLVEQLAFTELMADSDFARPPFDSCLFVYNSPLTIEYFYQIMDRIPPIGNTFPLSVFVTSLPSSAEDSGDRKLEFRCFHADFHSSGPFAERNLLIRQGWTIDRSLKTHWIKTHGYSEHDYSANEDENCFYDNEGLQFFRILINSILYLASNDPDVAQRLSPRKDTPILLKPSNKPKKAANGPPRKFEKTSSLDYTYVGRNTGSIVVDKSSHPEVGVNRSYLKKKLAIRFIVRGHWRNQPFGPSLSQKHLVWIRPYYKGPDMADLINKPYTVK